MSYKDETSPLDGILLPDFSRKVLVYGDVMLDRYWHGAVSRISPEAPVPVLQVNSSEDRAGGAANVALNVASLGSATHLFGITGEDHDGDVLRELMQSAAVQTNFLRDSQAPTLKKLRAVARQQQLMRMDFEQHLGTVDQTKLQDAFAQQLMTAGSVILSDYAKGTLQHVPQLIQLARQAGVPCCIDPKGKDFSGYRGATILTLTKLKWRRWWGIGIAKSS